MPTVQQNDCTAPLLDSARVRTAGGPQVLSGLRNAALRLLHGNGLSQIASALRHLAAFPMKAVQLVTQGRITDR
jgi:hypothetical protein